MNKKIIIISTIVVFIVALILVLQQVKDASFIVEPIGKSLVFENGNIVETAIPGLHVRFIKPDSILFYPTQRLTRFKKYTIEINNLTFADTCDVIEIPWAVSDPVHFFKTFGAFEEDVINKNINDNLLHQINEINNLRDSDYSFSDQIKHLNEKLELFFKSKGIRIFKID